MAGKKKKSKKKKVGQKSDKMLPVRIPQELIELFRRAANKDSRSLGNWVRDRIEKAAKRELGED